MCQAHLPFPAYPLQTLAPVSPFRKGGQCSRYAWWLWYVPCGQCPSPNLPLMSSDSQSLLPHIIPLVLVYFAEYFINQGLVSEECWMGEGSTDWDGNSHISDPLPHLVFAEV